MSFLFVFAEKFSPIYAQLEKMHLDDSPFVIISVIGQELLSAGSYACALSILEFALRIGTCSLKMRGSVFSALSNAHWALGNIDKAIACMQQDLAVAKSLGKFICAYYMLGKLTVELGCSFMCFSRG